MTITVTHTYTIDWQIRTTLLFSEENEPATSHCRDALGDATPGSVLQIEHIDIEEKTWNDTGWSVTGVVTTTYTRTSEITKTPPILPEVYDDAPKWVKNPPEPIVNSKATIST